MHFKVYFELIIYALWGCCNIKKKCKSYTLKEQDKTKYFRLRLYDQKLRDLRDQRQT